MEPVTIPVEDPPIMVGEKRIATLDVRGVSFKRLSDAFNKASSRATSPSETGKFFTREKMRAMLSMLDADGNKVEYGENDLLNLPVKYARQVRKALDGDFAPVGKILKEGDGITTPILYELGTPLTTDKGAVTELEFIAKTLGDIEDVMAAENGFTQSLELLQSVASPLGADVQLMRLPSWAVEMITAEDGLMIATKVLPSFLD